MHQHIALAKRRTQGDFTVSVTFSCGDTARLEVRDAGRAVIDETARDLLRGRGLARRRLYNVSFNVQNSINSILYDAL